MRDFDPEYPEFRSFLSSVGTSFNRCNGGVLKRRISDSFQHQKCMSNSRDMLSRVRKPLQRPKCANFLSVNGTLVIKKVHYP